MEHELEPDVAFARTAAQIPNCTLDGNGLARQRERYRRVSAAVTHVKREGEVLVVVFAPGFDRQALDELIAVERECCPFFTFSFEERSHQLEVGVSTPDAAGALDAIADGLSATARLL